MAEEREEVRGVHSEEIKNFTISPMIDRELGKRMVSSDSSSDHI